MLDYEKLINDGLAACGLTQLEAARRAGVDKSALSRWRRDAGRINGALAVLEVLGYQITTPAADASRRTEEALATLTELGYRVTLSPANKDLATNEHE
jgi:transcriptional regulator with XRE-family HTH domain